MKKYKLLIISSFIAFVMISASIWFRSKLLQQSQPNSDFNAESVLPPAAPQQQPIESFDATSIAKFNGKNGKRCYVAIDETVYEIEQELLWKDGRHITSGGSATCGQDLTEVIKQSPHGRSKLESLPKIGSYKKS